MRIRRAIRLVPLWLVALLPAHSLGQSNADLHPLLVGVIEAPPFSMKKEDGSWEGLSVELWQTIAKGRGC